VGRFDSLGFGLLILWTGSLQVILDKGQEDDWFGAPWIRWAAVVLFTTLFWFLVHCWRSKSPIVNLRVLTNRNFAVGCLLISMLGIAIYITITMLPLFYQEVLGYTALTAGIAVGPRGLGSMIGLPIIGKLSNKFDNRFLLCGGFTVFGLCSIAFARVHIGIGPTTLLIPIVITGFALSFVFVPIASMATATLSNQQMGNATGIFNLLRNIGGSIGISIATTMLVRRAAMHQTRIAAAVPQSGYWFQQRVATLSAYLSHQINPAQARAVAVGHIYGQLEQQALLWSFVDIFRWTALLAFLAAIMVWLFQRVSDKADGSVQLH
jgi:DHA2 family multidrug resistance protein